AGRAGSGGAPPDPPPLVRGGRPHDRERHRRLRAAVRRGTQLSGEPPRSAPPPRGRGGNGRVGRGARGRGLPARGTLRVRLVPMVVEEPSVVAAASYAARLVRAAGGFRAEADPPLMIGQIHVVQVPDVFRARTRLEGAGAGSVG